MDTLNVASVSGQNFSKVNTQSDVVALGEVTVHAESYAQGPHAETGDGSASAGLYSAGFDAEGDNGSLSGNLSGYSAETHANADQGLGASAALLKGNINGQYGTTDNNISGGASGSLLSVGANANVQGSTKNGVTNVGMDLHAGAAVASADVKGGFAIAGFGASGKVGVDAASIHGGYGYNIGVDANTHVGTIGIKADVGALIGINIDVKIQFPIPSF
jgi:hypothetical protein